MNYKEYNIAIIGFGAYALLVLAAALRVWEVNKHE